MTPSRTSSVILLAGAAVLAAPASAYASAPEARVASSSITADLLTGPAIPTFGGGTHWSRKAVATTQLRATCIPRLASGRAVTGVYALPGSTGARALQTVVQLPSASAARSAALSVSRRVRDCAARNTTVRQPGTSATTRVYIAVTAVPGEDDGWFGWIGIGWKGARMTVTYFGHGGQDSNFEPETFPTWIARATARLG